MYNHRAPADIDADSGHRGIPGTSSFLPLTVCRGKQDPTQAGPVPIYPYGPADRQAVHNNAVSLLIADSSLRAGGSVGR